MTFCRYLVLMITVLLVVGGCGKPKLEEIKVTPGEKTLTVGESTTFEAVALSDKDKKMPEVTFQWTTEGNIGSVDSSGRFTAEKPGEGAIIAKADSITGKAKITVKPSPVAKIEIMSEEEKALPGSKIAVKVKGLTADNQPAAYNEVKVSVATKGASASAQTLNLNKQGEAELEVTLSAEPGANKIAFQSGESQKEIQLEGTKITTLQILPDKDTFEVGDTVTFKAVGADAYGNKRSVQVDWSLTGEDSEMVEGGKVKMKRPGKGIILAKYGEMQQGHPFTIVPGKLAKLMIDPASAELKAGESTDFSVTGQNAHGYHLTVKVDWQVTGDVGTITQDGTFLAEKAGKGAVKAVSGEVSAEAPVKVEHGPLAGINIEIAKKKLQAGETIDLQAKGVDAYGNQFPVSPQWFLSKSLGTVNREKSTFTALYTGTGEIRAKIDNILQSVQIEIVPAKLAHLQLKPKSVDITAGDSVQFEVSAFDQYGNSVQVKPTLSIDEDLGKLSAAGLFEAKKAGSTSVRAHAGDLAAESTVAVAPAEMEKAVVKPAGPVKLTAGQAQEFNAFGLDRFGNTVKSKIAWQIHPEIGTVDEQGVFYPKKAGKGQINAKVTQLRTNKTLDARSDVSVAPGETTKIELQPAELKTVAGKERRFSAKAYDQFGNETDAAVTWSVEQPTLGNVSKEGEFRAIKSGSGKVVATHKNVTAASDIEIRPAEIAFLKIIPEQFSLKAGKKAKIEAIGEDRFGNVVEAKLLWSLSDPSLGKFEGANTLMAGKQGKGYLIATAGDIVDTAPLTVEKGALASVTVTPPEKTIAAGSNFNFSAHGFDAGGNALEITPKWSVEEALGSVQQDGLFEAKKVGQGKVSAVSGDVAGSAQVKVVPGKPASIDLAPQEITITAGDEKQLTLKVYDANKNLIQNPQYQWKVTDELGDVDSQKVFYAKKAGAGNIQLVSGDAKAKIDVTVKRGEVAAIEIQPNHVKTLAGKTVDFTAKAFDSERNELELKPTWSVGNGIGKVNEKGQFQALTVGNGYVAVQMNDVTGVATVSVQPGPISRVQVKPGEASLTAGSSMDFSATAFDAQGNTAPANFSWSLEGQQTLGEITSTGTLKASKSGTGSVVASADGVQGKAKVTVKPAELAKLTVSPKQISLKSGQSLDLSVTGEDAYGNEVPVKPDLSLQPPELGTVSPKGTFTAAKADQGTLVASVNNLQVSTPVTVNAGPFEGLNIELPKEEIMAGKTYQLQAVGYDAGGNQVQVEPKWAVTPNVGEIDQTTGVFDAGKAGKGLVTARSGGVVAEKPIEVHPGELYSLFLEPNPVTVQSNTTQQFKVQGYDVKKNQVNVSESAMEWNVVGGIGEVEAPGKFLGTKMGKGKVTAGVGNLLAESYVTVVPGTPDMDNSRVRVTYPMLPANGQSSSEVIVEVRDYYNNPVPDVQVTLVSNRQTDNIEQPPKTNAQGSARGKVSSNDPGPAVISAVWQGKTFLDTAKVTFE